MFGSVVAVAFQNIFEIYQNNFFYFLKINFDISTSKQSNIYIYKKINFKIKNYFFIKYILHYFTMHDGT
jgi:hypothetical protein